jgi:hypothetical protein
MAGVNVQREVPGCCSRLALKKPEPTRSIAQAEKGSGWGCGVSAAGGGGSDDYEPLAFAASLKRKRAMEGLFRV